MSARYADDDPVLAELLSIYKETSRLTPESVVEAAEDPNCALHTRFTWDNNEAGRLYRLSEARDLVRSYKVIIEQPDVEIRRFTHVKTDDGPGYMETTDVFENPNLRQQVLDRFVAELKSLEERYRIYVELAPHIDSIRRIIRLREDPESG